MKIFFRADLSATLLVAVLLVSAPSAVAASCQNALDNHLVEASSEIKWSQIKPATILPTLQAELEDAKKKIIQIAEQIQYPTFENTILALDFATERLDRGFRVFDVYSKNLRTDKIQKLEPSINALKNDLKEALLNDRLFERIKTIYDNYSEQIHAAKNRTPDEKLTVIEKKYNEFIHNGALLKGDKTSVYLTLIREIANLSTQFDNNVLASHEKLRIIIDNPDDLEGIPLETIKILAKNAEDEGKPGKWILKFDTDSTVHQVRTLAKSASLRKRIYYASTQPELAVTVLRPEEDNGSSLFRSANEVIAADLVKRRQEVAALLGYKSYAELRLKSRLIENTTKVQALYDELIPAVQAKALQELEEVSQFAESKYGVQTLKPWDFNYYAALLKEEKYSFNDEELKKYFELENSTQAIFGFLGDLFDIEFRFNPELDLFHSDVKGYEVFDKKTGKSLGTLALDLFARKKKIGGAWMSDVGVQGSFSEGMRRPWTTVNLNIQKPVDGQKTFLTFDEMTTYFHEMGHALHLLLSEVTYRSVAGTDVAWDFVEFPSQLMENWMFDARFLQSFARHPETGEVIPLELIQKIKESDQFLSGVTYLFQARLGYLDFQWHLKGPLGNESATRFEERVVGHLDLFPNYPARIVSSEFTHIFSGEYDMGYYSYFYAKLSEVDGFTYLNHPDSEERKRRALGLREHILSRGSSRSESLSYRLWRGQDFNAQAFFDRYGLKKDHGENQ